MTEEIKLRKGRKDLTGQRFGKLQVIKPVKTINDTSRWLCKCDCGNEKIAATYRLLSGRVKTCGDCFNTINFYVPELQRLEQENEELKQANKKMYQSMHKEICEYDEELGIEKASHESDLETLDTYRSALEEIKGICQDENDTCTGECGNFNVAQRVLDVLCNLEG